MEKIMNEESVYILGTDKEELIRLELQHKVWSSEAKRGWDLAEFKNWSNNFRLRLWSGILYRRISTYRG